MIGFIGGVIGLVWAISGALAAFLSGNAWAWRATIWMGPFAFIFFRPENAGSTDVTDQASCQNEAEYKRLPQVEVSHVNNVHPSDLTPGKPSQLPYWTPRFQLCFKYFPCLDHEQCILFTEGSILWCLSIMSNSKTTAACRERFIAIIDTLFCQTIDSAVSELENVPRTLSPSESNSIEESAVNQCNLLGNHISTLMEDVRKLAMEGGYSESSYFSVTASGLCEVLTRYLESASYTDLREMVEHCSTVCIFSELKIQERVVEGLQKIPPSILKLTRNVQTAIDRGQLKETDDKIIGTLFQSPYSDSNLEDDEEEDDFVEDDFDDDEEEEYLDEDDLDDDLN